ncbi:uncharacterized protein C10orf120 homolog [Myotis daubentonii]|uniref:uncharacterized protein C10orf120 homolog n=1 Tax=Myotis daubentonii TaxID=98922 RepID=UPI002873DB74|nr:uncharacterized protein C10orf120 homolog [Myotis daubentonii]
MLSEWEDGGQKAGQERGTDPRAPERKPQKNGVLSAVESVKDQDPLCCRGDRASTAPVGTWTKFHTSDPSIAPGKYSPLEKEILRLGGVHTVASRRFLTHKQEEERKMLRELQLRSPDYKQVLEYRQQFPPTFAPCGLLKKIWTAKGTVSPEDLRVPPRERQGICRHVERMQFARALRTRPLPAIQRAGSPGGPPAAGGEDAVAGQAHGDAAPGESEDTTAKRQEIKMSVIFKPKEPPKPLPRQPSELRPFFATKKAERSIAGFTNRSLFRLADFPGDLLLMNQDFISRGLHPSDMAQASHRPQQEGAWREPPGRTASHQH